MWYSFLLYVHEVQVIPDLTGNDPDNPKKICGIACCSMYIMHYIFPCHIWSHEPDHNAWSIITEKCTTLNQVLSS